VLVMWVACLRSERKGAGGVQAPSPDSVSADFLLAFHERSKTCRMITVAERPNAVITSIWACLRCQFQRDVGLLRVYTSHTSDSGRNSDTSVKRMWK